MPGAIFPLQGKLTVAHCDIMDPLPSGTIQNKSGACWNSPSSDQGPLSGCWDMADQLHVRKVTSKPLLQMCCTLSVHTAAGTAFCHKHSSVKGVPLVCERVCVCELQICHRSCAPLLVPSGMLRPRPPTFSGSFTVGQWDPLGQGTTDLGLW